jgi:hypothetical protein
MNDFFEELGNHSIGSKTFDEFSSPLRMSLYLTVGNGRGEADSKEIVFYVSEVVNALEFDQVDPMAFYIVKPYLPGNRFTSQASLGDTGQQGLNAHLYKGYDVKVGDIIKIKIADSWVDARISKVELSASGIYPPRLLCSYISNGREKSKWQYPDSKRVKIPSSESTEEPSDE